MESLTRTPAPLAWPIGRSATQRTAFASALLAATLLPVLAICFYYAVGEAGAAYVGVAFLGAIASTHVVATLYLLTDKDIRRFIYDNPIRMGLVPCAMIAVFATAFTMPGTLFFAAVVLLGFLYQTWHFGAQNIGVASFVSLCERSRPLGATEKKMIRAGIICGLLGILYSMPPTFGYSAEQMNVPPLLRGLMGWTYWVGKFAAGGLTLGAIYLALQSVRAGHPMTAIALATSIAFFFPMYLSTDFLFAIGMFSTAHGLQYIVFLMAHSAGGGSFREAGIKFGFLLAPAALALILLVAHFFRPSLIAVSNENVPLLGSILMGSLTLTHFWVDQHFWRLRERSAWVKSRYPFIFAKD